MHVWIYFIDYKAGPFQTRVHAFIKGFYNAHHNYKAKVLIGTFIHVVLYKILNQKNKNKAGVQ